MTREDGKKWAIIIILIMGLGTIICIVGINVSVNIAKSYTDARVDQIKEEITDKLDKIIEILEGE